MAIVYTKTDQGLTVATGTGAPVHTAVAGDRYTDTANGNTYQYTTIWNLMPLSGGLTYFTEAQNSTAPNATIKVDSLIALSSTTDGDVAIVPKGAGAFTLAVPNNLVSGGNKRGTYAIDLQTDRSQAIHVASASYSILIGGSGNKATGTGSSVIGGYNNTGSGSYVTILGGYGNTNSGSYGALVAGAENYNSGAYGASTFGWGNSNSSTSGFVAGYGNVHGGAYNGTIGQSNNNSGNRTFVAGTSNIVSSYDSFVFGQSNSALGSSNNFIFGRGGSSFPNSYGRFVFAGLNTALGDAQNTRMILSTKTTDTTLTTLTSDGGAPYAGYNEFRLQDNSCVRFKGTIVAKQTATTTVGVWDIDGVVTRVNSVATTTLNVSNINVVTNLGLLGTPTITLNANGQISFNVIGLLLTNIKWVGHIEFTEVVY